MKLEKYAFVIADEETGDIVLEIGQQVAGEASWGAAQEVGRFTDCRSAVVEAERRGVPSENVRIDPAI